jgi:YgiT-type zinc finger domain-containing protein
MIKGNNMECLSCKGALSKGTTHYTINRKGYHVLIDDLPAYICSQCGEALLPEEGVEKIQKIVDDMDLDYEMLKEIRIAV